jgi:hypothetical protein
MAGSLVALSVLVPALVSGCSGDDSGECATNVPSQCTPLYDPTFDNVYTRTLKPTCSLGGCHAPDSAQGGLAIDTEDAAYDALTKGGFVKGGDAECSLVVERITSSDSSESMPPGAPLSAAEQCSIITWIRNGAKR